MKFYSPIISTTRLKRFFGVLLILFIMKSGYISVSPEQLVQPALTSATSYGNENSWTMRKSCRASCKFLKFPSKFLNLAKENYTISADVTFTSFKGYGRTGNQIISLRNAIGIAMNCRKVIRLPIEDDSGGSFNLASKFSVLNFSILRGEPSAFCGNFSFPIRGNTKYFWSMGKTNRLSYELERQKEICIQKYLGICDEKYCMFDEMHELRFPEGVLVMHLREGDVFKPNFSSAVHNGYGQPPLSYYWQALSYRRWKKIIFVTEGINEGPISRLLHIVNQTLGIPFRIQTSSWYDDLRTCMCAYNLVSSKSTLENIFISGHARNLFSYRCLGNLLGDKRLYRIDIDKKYVPFRNHTNGPEEWVDMLLHRAKDIKICGQS